jgi:hypothetical protein
LIGRECGEGFKVERFAGVDHLGHLI